MIEISKNNDIIPIFEKYIKNILKIPYCNFEGIHPKIAYEFIVGLSLMYEMYPFFNKVICSIEQEKDLEAHVNILKNLENSDDYFEITTNKKYIYGFYSRILFSKNILFMNMTNYIPYFSCIIFDKVKNIDIQSIDNFILSNYGRFGVYHEFGHLLDNFLNISDNKELDKIISNYNIETEISKYANSDKRELVSCAFSRYIYSKRQLTKLENEIGVNDFNNIEYKSSNLVNEIGNFIDDEYKKFVKFRKLKAIKSKYDFNKKFTIGHYNNNESDNLKKYIKRYKMYEK